MAGWGMFEIRCRTATWFGSGTGDNYDVSANGQRFLVNTVEGDAASRPITVVVNGTAGLRR